LFPLNSYAEVGNSVFIIPVKGEIGPALAEFVIANIESAIEGNAHTIILEIDTLGGRLDYTYKIKDAVNKAINKGINIISFVNDEAQSAGVMIAMLGQKVAMAPGSSMGSAEVRPFDEKFNSAWAGELKAVAEARGRDGEIVAAMADKDIYIEGVTEKGKLLNVTTNRAKELGLCDIIVNNRQELLEAYGLDSMVKIEVEPNLRVKMAQFLSGSFVAPMLLILGLVALTVEVFTPSFGIAGTIGVLSLSAYFAGAILAGNSGWGAAILFIAGIVLMAIEASIPGFGAAGIGGIISLSLGIVFSASDIVSGLILLLIVVIALIAAIWLLLKYAPRNKLFNRIVLRTEMKSELGYSGSTVDRGLLGKEGIALTVLRPSGIADIEGRRVDVTTEGGYIQNGKHVRVIKVESNRVVVKEI